MAAKSAEESHGGEALEGESVGAVAASDGKAVGAASRIIALDGEGADDALAAIGTLPRVQSICVVAAPTRVEAKEPVQAQKANIGLKLTPFTPTAKRTMVTMSDMSGTGGTRGGVSPARNKGTRT